MPISHLIPSENNCQLLELITDLQQAEAINNYDTVRKDKQGRLIDISLSLTLLKDEEGCIIGVSGIARNISQQKQAEHALAESERRFRAIFNSTFQFMGLLTPEGILLEANQTALDFAGLSRDEVINRPFWQIRWWTISPETQLQLQQAIRQAASGAFVRYEVDVWGAENQVITLDFSLKPMLDDQGKVILLIPEGRDISDYCQMKMALQDSEERFRNAFDYAAIGKALVNLDGKFIEVNPSLCEILGYSESELQLLTFQEITHPDDLELDLSNVEKLLQGKVRSYSIEKRYFHKNGSVIWALLSASLVRDAKDNPAYFIAQITEPFL
jgi:PAS domain S-box-containing protein